MVPGDLQNESFARYPPQARAFAFTNLPVLKRMALVLLALVLRQMMQYDWCFPAEQRQLADQFDLLRRLDAASFDRLMAPFSAIALSSVFRSLKGEFSKGFTVPQWTSQSMSY